MTVHCPYCDHASRDRDRLADHFSDAHADRFKVGVTPMEVGDA